MAGATAPASDVNATAQVIESVGQYKRMVGDLVRQIVPRLLPIATEAELSIPCMTAMLQLINGVRNFDDWAISMLDATAKLPVGILSGTNLFYGEYDECLELENVRENYRGVKESLFQGQYCTVEILPDRVFLDVPPEHRKDLHPNSIIPTLRATGGAVFDHLLRMHFGYSLFGLRLGLCLPSVCPSEDINSLLAIGLRDIKFSGSVINCEVKRPNFERWEPYQIFILLATILVCCLTSLLTLVDLYYFPAVEVKEKGEKSSIGMGRKIVGCFSFWKNAKHLTRTKHDSKDPLEFISGLRVLSVMVITAGYSFSIPYMTFLHKIARKLNHVLSRERFLYGWFGHNSIPVDTLIFFSGFLAAYQYGRRNPKAGQFLKTVTFLLFTIIRSWGGMMLAIGVFVLFPLYGDGPDWDMLVMKNVHVCIDSWWRNFLFIQNFWIFTDNCMYQTYLISILVQCSVLATILLWITNRFLKTGLFLQGLCVIISGVASGLHNAIWRLPPALSLAHFSGDTLYKLLDDDLIKPYYHIAPYCLGMLLGSVFEKKFIWNKITILASWLTAWTCFLIVFYGQYNFPYNGDTYKAIAALYSSTYRIIWSMGLSAFVLLCVKGGDGGLKKILSWGVFIAMDRLTYISLVLHALIMLYYYGQSRIHFYLGYGEILLAALGFLTITYLLSTLIYALITAPIARLTELWRK